jgi:hypothetical protein
MNKYLGFQLILTPVKLNKTYYSRKPFAVKQQVIDTGYHYTLSLARGEKYETHKIPMKNYGTTMSE